MKGKIAVIAGVLLTIAVTITVAIWIMKDISVGFLEIGSIAIIIILIASASYILWDRVRNIRQGLPVKDERLILISYKAGYYGFIAAIFSATFGPVLIDIIYNYELEGSRVTALVVFVSGFVFVVSYLYLTRKGR